MENLTLNNGTTATFQYTDSWSRPVYKLQSGTKVCCVNCDGTHLHTISRDSEEPEFPVAEEYQPKIQEKPQGMSEGGWRSFDYMMLGKLQRDLDYYFGFGNRSNQVLHYKDINEQLAEIKKRLLSIPEDLRPEWLTEEQIEEYKKRI